MKTFYLPIQGTTGCSVSMFQKPNMRHKWRRPELRNFILASRLLELKSNELVIRSTKNKYGWSSLITMHEIKTFCKKNKIDCWNVVNAMLYEDYTNPEEVMIVEFPNTYTAMLFKLMWMG